MELAKPGIPYSYLDFVDEEDIDGLKDPVTVACRRDEIKKSGGGFVVLFETLPYCELLKNNVIIYSANHSAGIYLAQCKEMPDLGQGWGNGGIPSKCLKKFHLFYVKMKGNKEIKRDFIGSYFINEIDKAKKDADDYQLNIK